MAFATSIKEKHVGWIRWVLLGVFSVLAMAFSLFLFWNFPDKVYLRPFYAALGLIWELGTLYFAIRLKTAVALKKAGLIGWLLGYLVFVSVSVFGGIGFNLATTGVQAKAQADVSTTIQTAESSAGLMRLALISALSQASADVAGYESMLKVVPSDNLTRLDQVTRWKKSAVTAATDAALALAKFDEAARSTAVAKVEAPVEASKEQGLDVFGALGGMLGIGSADVARRWFFIIVVLMIQIIVLVSSPIIADADPQLQDLKGLMSFIDALFEVRQGKRLASPYRVARKMGIDTRDRDRYIATLTTLVYKNEAILKQGRSGLVTDYDLETFKKIVAWLLNHQRSDQAAEEDTEPEEPIVQGSSA